MSEEWLDYRRKSAAQKIEVWHTGVDLLALQDEVARFLDGQIASSAVCLRNVEERTMIESGAILFFKEFSKLMVELSDGRHVYFAPDPRSKVRGLSNCEAWAEYVVHAVTNGGTPMPDKVGHVRWYNHRKVENFDLIVPTLKREHCAPGIKSNPIADTIDFFGETHEGGKFAVIVRLDEIGNATADLTEVTFEAAKKQQKKSPQLKPLAEAVEAVVHHQAAGTNPSTDGVIIPK